MRIRSPRSRRASISSPRRTGRPTLQLGIFPEDGPIPLAPLERLWGLALRNRVRLLAERALARRQDDGSVMRHDLQGDLVRKRCPDVPATHDRLLRSYRPDDSAEWIQLLDDGYLLDRPPYHLIETGRGEECGDLLFDLAWLRSKLAARDVPTLIADTALRADDAEVERLGRRRRLSAHVLVRHQRRLSAQLLGRLAKDDGAGPLGFWRQHGVRRHGLCSCLVEGIPP